MGLSVGDNVGAVLGWDVETVVGKGVGSGVGVGLGVDFFVGGLVGGRVGKRVMGKGNDDSVTPGPVGDEVGS